MKNPLEWTSPNHRECGARVGEHTQCGRHGMQMMPLPFSWSGGQRNVTGKFHNLSIPICSVTGPLLILLPPTQPCACDSPQYSKAERHPVTALEKMMESSFAGPQSFPEVPSPDRGSQSVKHHRYRSLIMVEWAHSYHV